MKKNLFYELLSAVVVIASFTAIIAIIIGNLQQQQYANGNRIESNSTSTVCINNKPCVTTICINNERCRTFTANSTDIGNSTNNNSSVVLPHQETI